MACLAGSKKAKNEEKLFRDLMKFEGFGEDIRDLLKYTDHISKLVANKSKSLYKFQMRCCILILGNGHLFRWKGGL